MTLLRKFRLSPSLVLACIALAVALGGTGYAASRLPANSVTTRQVKNRSLLAVDFKQGQLPRGPAGPEGPSGPAGPQGPPGAAGGSGAANVKWALVKSDGTIAQQSGGISVTTHSAGEFVLDFGAATNTKLIQVSPGFAGDSSTRGTILGGPCGGTAEGTTCPAGNDTNHVIVRTYGPGNGLLADHAFYVAVVG